MTIGAQCRAWTIGIICLLSMNLAQADSRLGSDQVLELVARGDVLAATELVALHPELAEQEWLDIELERQDGRWIYELELLDAAGVVREYRFDARTGLSLGFEIED
ncbi:peptidase M4 [Reinekea forsetii]|nr:peptidase M4 [Reinekea forsetii]